MNPIDRLAKYFLKLPGIGPKQARRFAYFFLYSNDEISNGIITSLTELKNNIASCEHCFTFFEKRGSSDLSICEICSNKNTDSTKMMIISTDMDIETVKKIGVYTGRYFILGGTVPILKNKKHEKSVRGKELFNEVKRALVDDGLKEIIFAFAVNPDGEQTEIFVRKILDPLVKAGNLSTTHLGRGVSSGTELEYVDEETLRSALSNRS